MKWTNCWFKKAWWEELCTLDDVSRIYKAADELDRISKLSQDEEDEIEDEMFELDEQEETMIIQSIISIKILQITKIVIHKIIIWIIYLKLLSWVVKEYMWNSWYKKDDSKEKEEKYMRQKTKNEQLI